MYCVLLIKYFKICSEWLINYNPCKFTMIIADPLPGNPLEFLFRKDCKRGSILPSACPVHVSSILNWRLAYMHSSPNRPLVWLVTDVLMFSAFKIIALEKRVHGFPNKFVFCFKKTVAVPFSFLICFALLSTIFCTSNVNRLPFDVRTNSLHVDRAEYQRWNQSYGSETRIHLYHHVNLRTYLKPR